MESPPSARFRAVAEDSLLNIAHRGARAFAPENTLPAFIKAKYFGCQMFEIDVRLSKDGELMVHHDQSLTRCTDVQLKFPGLSGYELADFTWAQLNQLNAGGWFTQQLLLPATERQDFLLTLTDEEIAQFINPDEFSYYQSGAVTIPTLKQTLELASDLQMLVNVEIKANLAVDFTLTDSVVKLIKALNMEQRVLISAFEHEQLRRVRQLNQNIAIGVLTGELLANPSSYCQALDADAYHPYCYRDNPETGGRTLDLSGISELRQNGLGVNMWTCNLKEDMSQLIKAGVSGIISDFPNRLQELLLN